MTKKPQIKINNPCPMTPSRLKDGSNFSCKSCNQTLIDFRDKTTEEIIKVISVKKTCGIFNHNQVIVPEFSFTNNFIFKVLTVFAIFGFNVKPLNAQTNQVDKDSINIQKQNGKTGEKVDGRINPADTNQIKPRKKKWWRKKKKPNYRVIGTPSF